LLFQELIGSIIGSVIATIGSIMVWVIIEFLKKYRDKLKLRKKIRLLYNQFAKRRIEPYMAIKIANFIDEIGKKNILTVLKLILDEKGMARVLISEGFIVKVIYGHSQNNIDIRYNDLTYNFEIPNKNQECLDKFLEFYREQCKNEKIRLKERKRVNN